MENFFVSAPNNSFVKRFYIQIRLIRLESFHIHLGINSNSKTLILLAKKKQTIYIYIK